MSTTTIRLPKELKDKVARAAQRAGVTAHSFMLEAISEKAERDELQTRFADTAEQRYEKIIASGKSISWATMRRYLEQRLADNRAARRPKPRRLAR